MIKRKICFLRSGFVSVKSEFLKRATMARSFFRGKERYLGVVAVFLIALWYNLVVAPVDGLKKDSLASFSNIEEQSRVVAISENQPEKTYRDVLQSISGDWHRIGITAHSYDSDETLEVFAISEMGENAPIGILELKKGEPETYHEFLFASNDAYRDIVIRRTGETEMERWGGGDVAIGEVLVTRLAISSKAEANQLVPTIKKESQTQSIVARDNTSDRSEIFFPGEDALLSWGVFESPGDHLISVAVSAKKTSPETNGTYVIELRGYDSSSKVVDKKILKRKSFTESEAMSVAKKNEGLMRFDFPERLEMGASYAVSIRLEKERGLGGLEFAPIITDSGARGPIVLEVQPTLSDKSFDRLFAGARIEDIGPFLRYEYRNSGQASDFFNIADMTDSVKFSSSDGIVLADAKIGEFFSYAVDTIFPFSEVFIRAEQYRDYEDQISMEYSFDESSWVEIPYEQDHKEPQRFSLRIPTPDSDTANIFIAVRYKGEEDTRRKFGLASLEVIAKMPKGDASF